MARFSISTDDGFLFAVRDRAKVIAVDVTAGALPKIVKRRIDGDPWRTACRNLLLAWNNTANQFFNPHANPWEMWCQNRTVSFNSRSGAMCRFLKNGTGKVREDLYLRSRRIQHREWESKLASLLKTWETEKYGSGQSRWAKWCGNVASNHRKRLRRKGERKNADDR